MHTPHHSDLREERPMERIQPSKVHNVDHPADKRYHLPERGGQYAARNVAVAQHQEELITCWHSFSADDNQESILCQVQNAEPMRFISDSPIASPAVTARYSSGWLVGWSNGKGQLIIAEENCAKWSTPTVLHQSEHWLRDLFACGNANETFIGAVQSAPKADKVLLFQRLASGGWRQLPTFTSSTGRIFRPNLIVDNDTLLLAFEQLDPAAQRSVVVLCLREGEWQESTAIQEPEISFLLPRLTRAADGCIWMTLLADRVVERDGVISHAISIRVMRRPHSSSGWQSVLRSDDLDYALLYCGLLPQQRYFGYSGLRRNPQPLALQDGRVYVCWEAQRSEEEDWYNLSNGRWMALRLDENDPQLRVLTDQGVCFHLDFQAIHPAEKIQFLSKGPHNDDGMDFSIQQANLDRSPCQIPDSPQDWPGWQPYSPHTPDAPAQAADTAQPLQLYFGDFHNHSVHSPDAEGFADELYAFSRHIAGLDFAGITDNDFYPNKALLPSESFYQRQLLKLFEVSDRFIPFTGFEWTFHRNDEEESYNHRSIIFHSANGDRILHRIQPSGYDEQNFAANCQHLAAFAHAHHGQFKLLGLPQEANVEVTSGWAINIENSTIIHEQLDAGHVFGFIGGSDSHRAVPGLGGALVAVWAKDLSRTSIIEALQARRCYATNGNRTIVDFRLNSHWMGETVHSTGNDVFTVYVRATNALKRVSIVSSSGIIHDFPISGKEIRSSWQLQELPKKKTWYYLRVETGLSYQPHPHNVCQAVGHLAWSSPIWLQPC